jgi:hypothetical protein
MGDTGRPRCRPAVAYLGEDYPVSCVFTHASCVFTVPFVRAYRALTNPAADAMTLG